MAASSANTPFAIQLEVEFLDRLNEPVREGKVKSVSEIIRAALESFDLANVVVVRPPQLLISVRLPAHTRRALKRAAREKHTSVGQLVRAAVEAYLPRLESAAAGQLEIHMPVETNAAEPAPSPAAPAKPRPPARKKPARAKTAPATKRAGKARPRPGRKPAARRRAKR